MHLNHNTSANRTQSLRIFQHIQQVTGSTDYILKAEHIATFLKQLGLQPRHDLIRFMHEIDQEGREMGVEYWGHCISKAMVRSELWNQVDYAGFHRRLRALLLGEYVLPLEGYELWDGNGMRDEAGREGFYLKIVENYAQLSIFFKKMDFNMFDSNIGAINECFSLLTLAPDKRDEIVNIYQTILGGNFIENLQVSLSTNLSLKSLVQVLKSLCYLYQAMKYEPIRKLLQLTILVQPEIIKGLLQNANDERPEIRYYTCVMMGLMINNVKNAAEIVFTDKDLLYNVSNAIAKVKQQQGLVFGLEFLINIIKYFGTLTEAKKQESLPIISVYLNFAVNKLWELKSEATQSVCMNLVAECLKATQISDEDAKLLKFVDNVFQGNKQVKFQSLFESSLKIVKNSLLYNRKNVQDIVLTSKSFEQYIKSTLKQHQDWQPFYLCLQLILIIAQSPSNDILFQRNLIVNIFELTQSSNNLVVLYVSEIVYYLIANSLQTQWKITYLYEKQCLKVIANLLGKFDRKDVVLESEYRHGGNFSCYNWSMFALCFRSLYMLNSNAGTLTSQKKAELYTKNFSIFVIDRISSSIASFFTAASAKYVGSFIRKQIKVDHNHDPLRKGSTMKLFTLISKIIEEMTLILRKRNCALQVLRQVNHTRNQFHRYLYGVLSYNELVTENIPVYLVYSADIEGMNRRQRVYRLSWNEYRSLLWQFIKKSLNIEVEYFKIVQKSTGVEIRTQDQYRRTVEKILRDYSSSNFVLETTIIDIKQKLQNLSNRMTESQYRGPAQIPKFMSYRLPQARDTSPFGSKRINQGSPNNNKRDPSPNFGSPCMYCKKSTTNRSQICNMCVQAQSYI